MARSGHGRARAWQRSVSNVDGFPANGLKAEGNRWHLQGGVRRNWFGIGDTSLYAEYGVHRGWQGTAAAVTLAGTSADKLSIWGVGVVQNIDAAAMELYLGYRNYKLDGVTFVTAGIAVVVNGPAKDVDVIAAGARIKF